VKIPLSLDEAEQALAFIDPDLPREDWVRVGMALKSEFGDAGLDLFDAWSANGTTYDKANLKTTWRGLRATGGVTIGTLLAMAREGGWQREATVSKEELAARQAAREARRKALEEQAMVDEQAAQAWRLRVAEAAARLWETELQESGVSGYLARKRVGAFGVRFAMRGVVWVTDIAGETIELITDRDAVRAFFDRAKRGEIDRETISFMYLKRGTLVVPLRDAEGKLWSLQFINAKGTKLFPKFGRKRGLFYLLGDSSEPAPVVAVAEGYATAVSVHLATRWPVAVAFDAGNLLPVSQALRERFPASRLVLAADADKAGVKHARAAAEAVGGVVAIPQFQEVAA